MGIGGEDPNEWWACGVDPKTRGAAHRRVDADPAQPVDEGGDDVRRQVLQAAQRAHAAEARAAGGRALQVGGRSDAALQRTARYGDAWTGIWVSPRRFAQAGEIIAEFAAEAGRGDVTFERGMQFWMGVDDDKATARAKVAGSMKAFYQLPFESFEKYTPYGTPREIAEFIAPYIEAGCRWVNFVIADEPEATLDHALAVRDALRDVCK